MNSTVPPPKFGKQDPLIGTVVNGKFRVVSLVASGGMGKIYQAEQMPLGRTVALKVLHAQTNGTNADDPQFKKRFFREASILAKLQHPNIVTVFDYGAIDGSEDERYFMAMEYLSGETLARRITERASLSPQETIRIARQIARGLTEAHAQGIIHRDLKPSNVMLVPGRDGEEQVKIVDFGIVKIVGDESMETEELTQEGSFIGSPKYMAPEQIQRGGKVDTRTDIYSFGIILYQCLCGTVPFDGASSIQTLMAHLNQAPQSLRERAPSLGIPDWLEQIVMTCIEKEPANRPQAMDAVARALAEAEAAFTSNRLMPALSGSGPHSPAALLQAGVVGRSGSFPEIAAPSTGRHSRQMRQSSGPTEQGTISSVVPGDSDKTRTSPGAKPTSRGLAAILIAGGVAALAAVLFFVLHNPAPAPQAAAPPVAPPAPIAQPKREFAMTIESTPSGAEVKEGDRVLGTTPLQLTIDNDGARLEPRRFVITKDGYVAYSLVQGPSQESVRVVAPLAAAPTPAATSAPPPVAHAAPPHHAPSPKPSTAPASTGNGLDIRLTR